MSKNKGGKHVKKAPATDIKKNTSDYQAGKISAAKDEASPNKKK